MRIELGGGTVADAHHTYALRFGELGLKSAPVRRNFQRVLIASLDRAAILNNIDLYHDRVDTLVLATTSGPREVIEGILRRCFGMVGCDPVTQMDLNPEVVAAAALKRDNRRGEARTFAVRCRRSGSKTEWNSQTFAGTVGYHMLELDPSLKVNLSNPDITVRVHITPKDAWLMEERIPGPGGLPCGVQGNVIANIQSESDLLSAWQVMRRGAGIVPLKGSDDDLMAILDDWDAGLGEAAKGNISSSRKKKWGKRTPWGFIGMPRMEAEKLIRIDRDRITPPVELDATQGWSESEKSALLAHIKDPILNDWGHAGNSALLSWIE
jgi:thiamine biosynthesis protein ThiI